MAPIDPVESERLYAWIGSERHSRLRDLATLVFRAFSDRFSRRRTPARGAASHPADMAIDFPASEKQPR